MARNIWKTAEKRAGRWLAKSTFPNGQVKRFSLDPRATKAEALARAAEIAQMFESGKFEQPSSGRQLRAAGLASVPSDNEYALVNAVHRWSGIRSSKLASSADSHGHLINHFVPHAPHDVRDITSETMDTFAEYLEMTVDEGGLAPKTARNVWGSTAKFCKDLSRKRGFKLLSEDPCRNAERPELGNAQRSKPWLFPNEATQLFECEGVPLGRRRIYASAIYLAARAAEIAGMVWADYEPEANRFHIHRQKDRKTGELVPTKTALPRYVPVCEALGELFGAMRDQTDPAPSDAIFPNIDKVESLASLLREDLMTAGLTRASLFANDATNRHMVFHDHRASGITWWVIEGVNPLWIQARAGHRDLSTTQRYIRAAETVGINAGTPFPSLSALLEPTNPLGQKKLSPILSPPMSLPACAPLQPSEIKEAPEHLHVPGPASPTGFEPGLQP